MKPDSTIKAKRFCKYFINAFKDPYPRNKILYFNEILKSGDEITFKFEALGEIYCPKIILPKKIIDGFDDVPEKNIQQILIAIGVTLIPSFFKITDFECVRIRAATLDSVSREFFEKFLLKGLGEFRYLQGLDPLRKVRIEVEEDNGQLEPYEKLYSDKLVMLNGGGKDTIVAVEILKKTEQNYVWLTVNPNGVTEKVVEISKNSDAYNILFIPDKKMKNAIRYPWGHVPFSAICSSLGTLFAMAIDARYVASGNESSANFGNVIYKGHEINHQYSKSFEFENGFFEFVRRRVAKNINVFSILRPFDDLQLAMFFSDMKDYHLHFISCNKGISRGKWCNDCPKCAFTSMALYPFIGSVGVQRIFGEDILKKTSICNHIENLVSDGIKPWECVGTLEESKLALSLIIDRFPEFLFDGSDRKEKFKRIISGYDKEFFYKKIIETINPEHIIPNKLVCKINKIENKNFVLPMSRQH